MSAVPSMDSDGTTGSTPPKRRGGLSHLMSKAKEQAKDSGRRIEEIPLDEIQVLEGFNPRTVFDPLALEELANSIVVNGVLDPALVRKVEGGGYHLIDGERRLRASRLAREKNPGVKTLPCLVFEGSIGDREALYLALATGLKERLGAFEEASVFARLREDGVTVEEISRQTGYAEPFIFERLRLASMPEAVKDAVTVGEISLNQAKKMLQEAEGDPEAMLRALDVAKGNKPRRGRPKGSKNKPKAQAQPPEPQKDPVTYSHEFVAVARGAVEQVKSIPPANCLNCAPSGYDPQAERCQECEHTQAQRASDGKKVVTGGRPTGAQAAMKALNDEWEKQVERLAGGIEFNGVEADLRKMKERLNPFFDLCRKAMEKEHDPEMIATLRKLENMMQGMFHLLRTVMRDGK